MSAELPEGWTTDELSSLATSALGKMLDKAKQKRGTWRPYLRNVNVQWDRIDLDDLNEMPFEEDEEERFALRAGDLLICEGGEPGRSAIWSGGRDDIRYQKALHRVRPGPRLDARFLLHHLRWDAQRGALEDYFTGTTIRHFPGSSLARYVVRHPPVTEQRKVAAHLDACFARTKRAKAALDEVPALLDRLRQSILAAAFRGDLTADWRAKNPDVEPASELLKRIRVERRRRWEEAELAKMLAKGKPPKDERWKAKYEEPEPVDEEGLPELPDGWCWANLASLVSAIDTGASFRCEERPPEAHEVGVLKVSAVSWGEYDDDESKTCRDEARINDAFFVEAGDLLVSRANTIELVGAAVIAENIRRRVMLSDKILRLRVLETSKLSPWILFALQSPTGRAQIESGSTGNQLSMRNISQASLLSTRIPIPPESEMRLIALALKESRQKLSNVAVDVTNLRSRIEKFDEWTLDSIFEQ